ncbi:MAG: hypothetical protein WA061_02660 [Microgenomates group bacterium]
MKHNFKIPKKLSEEVVVLLDKNNIKILEFTEQDGNLSYVVDGDCPDMWRFQDDKFELMFDHLQ